MASIKELLTNFARVKPKLEKKDIGQYKTVSDLRAAVDALKDADLRSNKEKERDFRDMLFKTGEAELIHRDPELIVISPKTPRASCYFGTNTKWCTASKDRPEKFHQYNRSGPLYIFIYQKKKYQLSLPTATRNAIISFLDETDSEFPIDLQSWFINRVPGLREIIKKSDPGYYHKLVLSTSTNKDPSTISKDPAAAIEYAINVVKGKWPEGETAISQSSYSAFKYVSEIIKGRWPMGESAISQDSRYAYLYAKDILKKRWPEGEPAISKDSHYASLYATEILEERWPEGEPAISRNPEDAYEYALEFIHGRWPEAEDALLSDLEIGVAYCVNIAEERIKKFEDFLLKLPKDTEDLKSQIAYYTHNVIKGRWPEAEDRMFSHDKIRDGFIYCLELVGGRVKAYEEMLLNAPADSRDLTIAIRSYALKIIKGRWPEAERRILKDKLPGSGYAELVLKSRWKEYENLLVNGIKNNTANYSEIVNYAFNVLKRRWPEVESYLEKHKESNKEDYEQYIKL